ncbi:hypothetical protein FB45DRAFT_932120 [Roridomyces roridus]|uniref:Uncharacterized protein n=1 Tax=Roridomyces roridus TaxID=1738132 RepID=A0AAD7BEV9_9AGAR|nr:hypothetical protein FB45DRAFT_932120 [Roridomyces roridus]
MVSRAKSDRVKGHENSRKKELNVRAAVGEYEREQAKPESFGKKKSIRTIATDYKVAYGTLYRRIQILEEANATMVLQNMGLKKMNEALHEREEKAATDRARLFKGKAQCLSSDEFHAAVKEMEDGKKAKEAGKEAKKALRERRKQQREDVEKEWAAMKARHDIALEERQRECDQLTNGGVRKKDHPPKPKLGKKSKVPVVEQEEDDEEEDLMDDEEV